MAASDNVADGGSTVSDPSSADFGAVGFQAFEIGGGVYAAGRNITDPISTIAAKQGSVFVGSAG